MSSPLYQTAVPDRAQVYTPSRGSSDDLHHVMTELQIDERQYRMFVIKKEGKSWINRSCTESSRSEDEIYQKLRSSLKLVKSVEYQLTKMSPPRKMAVDDMLKTVNNRGYTWQIASIINDNLARYQSTGKVDKFFVILERDPRRQSSMFQPELKRRSTIQVDYPTPSNRRSSKYYHDIRRQSQHRDDLLADGLGQSLRSRPATIADDPFGEQLLFGPDGKPINIPGQQSVNVRLPPHLPPEKPIGHKTQNDMHQQQEQQNMPGGWEGFGQSMHGQQSFGKAHSKKNSGHQEGEFNIDDILGTGGGNLNFDLPDPLGPTVIDPLADPLGGEPFEFVQNQSKKGKGNNKQNNMNNFGAWSTTANKTFPVNPFDQAFKQNKQRSRSRSKQRSRSRPRRPSVHIPKNHGRTPVEILPAGKRRQTRYRPESYRSVNTDSIYSDTSALEAEIEDFTESPSTERSYDERRWSGGYTGRNGQYEKERYRSRSRIHRHERDSYSQSPEFGRNELVPTRRISTRERGQHREYRSRSGRTNSDLARFDDREYGRRSRERPIIMSHHSAPRWPMSADPRTGGYYPEIPLIYPAEIPYTDRREGTALTRIGSSGYPRHESRERELVEREKEIARREAELHRDRQELHRGSLIDGSSMTSPITVTAGRRRYNHEPRLDRRYTDNLGYHN